MKNVITWFEIPVTDLDRAQHFYEAVLACSLHREDFSGGALAVFPYERPAPGGCLQAGATGSAAPGTTVRIYLDCGPDIDAVLDRIAPAGGNVTVPKTALPRGLGFIARMRDTEGNEVGLHSVA